MSETDSTYTDSSAEAGIAHRQSRKAMESRFAPCFKVTIPGSEAVLVPIDKASSDNKRMLLVAKVRMLVEKQTERLMNATLTPAEIKDMVKAVTDLDALQREQYITSLNNASSSGLGKEMGNIIKSAAEGATQGAMGWMDRMKKLDEAGKKLKPVLKEEPKAIDV